MHDIWNPWHGCLKASEGCANCYMYFLDRMRGEDGSRIYRTRNFNYPLQHRRGGGYKIASGETIRVCMTSDFVLKEADAWRPEAWQIMRQRSDVIFFLLTKRPERVAHCLPPDWGNGWENVWFNVTCENQQRAVERLPILLELPFLHKGVMAAPLLGPIDMEQYLATGQIEQVMAGGENYDGARPCDFNWIKSLSAQCKASDVKFCFLNTGTVFIKDGRTYRMPDHHLQSQMASKADVNHLGRPIKFRLFDTIGFELTDTELFHPTFRERCNDCGSRMICNGCADCGRCKK